MGNHARLSPSSGPRWLYCPASVPRTEALPDEGDGGPAAQWGTESHAYVEKAWECGLSPEFLHDGSEEEREKAECAQEMYNYLVQRHTELKPVAVNVEMAVNPGKVAKVEDCYGTADGVVCSTTILEVVDLKTGRGIVEPDSVQLGLYLLGALNEYWPDRSNPCPFEEFLTTIVQPRAPHELGPIRTDSWTLEQLLKLEERLKDASIMVASGNPLANPGDGQCRWCRVKGECPEYAQWMFGTTLEASGIQPDAGVAALELASATGGAHKLGSDQIAQLLQLRDSLISWLDAVGDEAMARLSRREPIPGYKLIRGTGRPAWKGEKDAVPKALRKLKLKKGQIFNDSLKTPLQVMKSDLTEEQSKAITELWHRPEGALKVVPSTNPGEDVMAQGGDFKPIQ